MRRYLQADHGRRYFHKALGSDPVRAEHALALIRRLYRVERSIATAPRKKREETRREKSRPLVDAFFAWCDEQATLVLDDTPISKALGYAHDACLEDVRCDPGRGLDKAMLRDLATCRWIDSRLNVIIVGKTGVGKSYLAAALAQAACRHGRRALFARVPRLVHDLAIARADGTYTTVLARLARIEVLVLDDFLLAPMKDSGLRDLLEILEDRYDHSSTVINSQIPTKRWHELLSGDRLVHNAHVIALQGASMREKKGTQATKPTATR